MKLKEISKGKYDSWYGQKESKNSTSKKEQEREHHYRCKAQQARFMDSPRNRPPLSSLASYSCVPGGKTTRDNEKNSAVLNCAERLVQREVMKIIMI
jgi:hypothetical protein